MVKKHADKCAGIVAAVALVVGGDMSGAFTKGLGSIMATAAGSLHRGVIHARYPFPEIGAVAVFANWAAGNMGGGLGRSRHQAASVVAAGAVARQALELSLYVAGFTAEIAVGAFQRKAGLVMVERPCRRRGQDAGEYQHQAGEGLENAA